MCIETVLIRKFNIASDTFRLLTSFIDVSSFCNLFFWSQKPYNLIKSQIGNVVKSFSICSWTLFDSWCLANFEVFSKPLSNLWVFEFWIPCSTCHVVCWRGMRYISLHELVGKNLLRMSFHFLSLILPTFFHFFQFYY